MKKYNRFSIKAFLISAIVIVTVFFAFMGATFAFFTATATNRVSSAQTAILRVGFSSGTKATIQNVALTETHTLIDPGDVAKYEGKIENTGNVDIYVVLELTIKVDGESSNLLHAYYHPNGNPLTMSGGAYITPAALIKNANSENFSLQYVFDGDTFDNSYMNKTVKINVVAHAIQVANINDAVRATNILLGVQN